MKFYLILAFISTDLMTFINPPDGWLPRSYDTLEECQMREKLTRDYIRDYYPEWNLISGCVSNVDKTIQ